MKQKRVATKNILLFICMLSLLILSIPPVMAQGLAPIKIYALVEEGLEEDIAVSIISVDNENERYEYTITKNDRWAINAEIPPGEYRAEATLPGHAPNANVQARAQFLPEIVRAGAEGLDIATFTVMQATAAFMEQYGHLVGYSQEGEEHIVGYIDENFAIENYHETVAAQDQEYREGGSLHNAHAITQEDVDGATVGDAPVQQEINTEPAEAPLDAGYAEEEVEVIEETPDAIDFEPVEEETQKKFPTVAIGSVLVLVAVIGIVVYRRRN